MQLLTINYPVAADTNLKKLQFLVALEEQNRLKFNAEGDLVAYRKRMKSIHFLRNPFLDEFRANESLGTEEEKYALLQSYKIDNPMNADLSKDIN